MKEKHMISSTKFVVKKLKSFIDLTDNEISTFSSLPHRLITLSAGREIVHEGQRAHNAFILLDGWVARTFNQQSEFGAQFDPLADSLYRIGAFTALAAAGLIPVWAILVFAWRDVLVSYARLMMQSKGVAVGARLSGKLKAIVQGVAIIALLGAPLIPASWLAPAIAHNVANASFWIAIAVTAWSCVDYLLAGRRPARARS